MVGNVDTLWSIEIEYKGPADTLVEQAPGIDANYAIAHETNEIIPLWCSPNPYADGQAYCHLFFLDAENGNLKAKYKFAYDEFDSSFTYSGYSSMIVVRDALFIRFEPSSNLVNEGVSASGFFLKIDLLS